MNLRPHIESIHQQLAATAEAGGDEARAAMERLMAPIDSTIRLTLLDVLTAAAEEITCDLAPGSVEVRLRGRDPEFVVTPPPADPSADDQTHGDNERQGHRPVTGVTPPAEGVGDEAAMSRINLRMPEHLKARVEHAAADEGLSWVLSATRAGRASWVRQESTPSRAQPRTRRPSTKRTRSCLPSTLPSRSQYRWNSASVTSGSWPATVPTRSLRSGRPIQPRRAM